ncbi:hypothetical protein SLEP1_g15447 [Rubroshorea leprosula]|uniref:Uncharacterized protein n=1 Tax=Rubroshorea leprosula TaxID=152421 RepID=A0AAV5IT90_9ROSI|nr:hypothetical protein SLEP1_g15447 [Rubroshorea leprosula]
MVVKSRRMNNLIYVLHVDLEKAFLQHVRSKGRRKIFNGSAGEAEKLLTLVQGYASDNYMQTGQLVEWKLVAISLKAGRDVCMATRLISFEEAGNWDAAARAGIEQLVPSSDLLQNGQGSVLPTKRIPIIAHVP